MSKTLALHTGFILQSQDDPTVHQVFQEQHSVALSSIRGAAYQAKNRDNEDRVATAATTDDTGELVLLDLVCDGLGGYADGAQAAQLFCETFVGMAQSPFLSAEQFIQELLMNVMLEYREEGLQSPSGTTFVISITQSHQVTFMSLGDSKGMLFAADGQLISETTEHKPPDFPDRFRLTEYVQAGNTEDISQKVQHISIPREELPEQTFLILCSDGITDNMVNSREEREVHPQLQHLIMQYRDPESLCRAIMDQASQRMSLAGTNEGEKLDVKPDNTACLVRMF